MILTPDFLKKAFFTSLVPLVGVLFFDWSSYLVLLSYWLESAVIGIFQILKIRVANFDPEPPFLPVDIYKRLPLIPKPFGSRLFLMTFIGVVYFGFMSGHLEVMGYIAATTQDVLTFDWLVLLSAVPLIVTHGQTYLQGCKKSVPGLISKDALIDILTSPFKRIIVIQFVLILGALPLALIGNTYPKVAILLVILKICFDKAFDKKPL